MSNTKALRSNTLLNERRLNLPVNKNDHQIIVSHLRLKAENRMNLIMHFVVRINQKKNSDFGYRRLDLLQDSCR